MKKFIVIALMSTMGWTPKAKADLWGADLPLLAEIVINTLMTLNELQRQTKQWKEEMDGIDDRIDRIRTIADVVQPSSWEQWKDPQEAVRRLRLIYQTLPKEYRSEKSDLIESEIAKAMNLVARVGIDTKSTFASGKELEQRALDSSPGVAQKLTASGMGTLISMEAQTQVIQSHITSLLTQMLADANERETRTVVSQGSAFGGISGGLGSKDTRFSTHALFSRRP
jgi:hypothetical protein